MGPKGKGTGVLDEFADIWIAIKMEIYKLVVRLEYLKVWPYLSTAEYYLTLLCKC